MTAGELPDGGLVVRGGQLVHDRLLRRSQRDRRADGECALSVWGGTIMADETEDDLLARLVGEAPIKHGLLNIASVRAVKAAGFALERTPPPDCHYDLKLGTVVNDAVIDRFVEVFDRQRRNEWRS